MLTHRVGLLAEQIGQTADSQALGFRTNYRRRVETCGAVEAGTLVDEICRSATDVYQQLLGQMQTGAADIEQALGEMLRQAGVNTEDINLTPSAAARNVAGDTDAGGFVADELIPTMAGTIMNGISAALATKGLFMAALNVSLSSAVHPTLFRFAMLGLGKAAFIGGVGGAAATGTAAGTVQAAGVSIFLGPAGWIAGGVITGFTMYRGWRKAKRKNAQLVLDQACDGLRGAAAELRRVLEEARDNIITALPAA
jgi:hypothetical protein